jgi:hypothetical protein
MSTAAAVSSIFVFPALPCALELVPKPSLFGIEHLSMDSVGDVTWKGIIIEQFYPPEWANRSWREWMRSQAAYLAGTCLQLEAEGIQPTLSIVCGDF